MTATFKLEDNRKIKPARERVVFESIPASGVSTESGSDRVAIHGDSRDCQDDNPVATAPGTDLITLSFRKTRHIVRPGSQISG